MTADISASIVELDREAALATVKERAVGGADPVLLLDECRRGMTIVGERFQAGDYFLAELMLSAEIFKGAVSILEPFLSRARPTKPLGTIVLATLKGDIHDLGKNIFATLLKSQGFAVHDLGVDADPAMVVDKVREMSPDFVGFSALITSTFDSMKQASELLREAGLRERFKLMIGGGVTTPMVRDYVGADFQTTDATEGVSYCINVIGGK